jgi:hypothetical protein
MIDGAATDGGRDKGDGIDAGMTPDNSGRRGIDVPAPPAGGDADFRRLSLTTFPTTAILARPQSATAWRDPVFERLSRAAYTARLGERTP